MMKENVRLSFLYYELKNYNKCVKFIKYTLNLCDKEELTLAGNSTTASQSDIEYLHFKLAKCLFRRWMKYSDNRNLTDSLSSYKIAIKNKEIIRRPDIYFELAAILLRLGRFQGFFDTLGAAIVIFAQNIDYLQVIQYNIAQILFVKGQIEEAYKIYVELSLSKNTPNLIIEDSIYILVKGVNKFNISIEIAMIFYRKGDLELFYSVLNEIWQNFNHNSKLRLNETDFDFLMGHIDFDSWFNDPWVWKTLGDHFYKDNNFVFAGEFYGYSAEIFSFFAWDSLSKIEKSAYVNTILSRSECMWSVSMYELAEYYAHIAFNLMPTDPVVIGRASRCCRENIASNYEIHRKAVVVFKRFADLYAMMRMNAYRGRRKRMKRYHNAITKLNSYIRMHLTRSKNANLRLANVSIRNNLKLVCKLRNIWKTGQESIQNWVKIWDLNAVMIQNYILSWLRKRKFRAFWKGINTFRRIFRGQVTRYRCRKAIEEIQKEIDATPDLSIRCCIDLSTYPIYINVNLVDVISSGTRAFSYSTTSMNSSIDSKLNLTYKFKEKTPHHISDPLPKSIYFLEQFLQSEIGKTEDVISIIGCPPLNSQSRTKWVPFGVLSDAAIARLMICSSLVIKSPSFSMTDCKRLCGVIERSKLKLWENIRSLYISGTCMGRSGMIKIISLGVEHLETLSITNTGITHHFGDLIGSQCWNLNSSNSISNLTKIYIDNESKFGDRGCEKLIRYLQHMNTLKTFSITYSNLTSRSIKALNKLCTFSKSLKYLILSGNHFKKDDFLSIIRVIANKGSFGSLSSINMRFQIPDLNENEIINISQTTFKISKSIKIYSSLLSNPELYSKSVNIENEATAVKDLLYFDEIESKRINNVIENTKYSDVDMFLTIASGNNCFTKSFYI